MTQERFRLNETSVANDGLYAGDNGGVDYKLRVYGDTVNSTTSSWEGSRAMTAPTAAKVNFRNAANTGNLTPGIYYVDAMVFIPTGETGTVVIGACSNDSLFQYSWVDIQASGGNYTATIRSYDTVDGVVDRTSTITAGAINAWCRVRLSTTAKGVSQVELWTGSALPQPDGTNENATPTATSTQWAGGTFSNWQYNSAVTEGTATTARVDDVLINLFSPPTRVDPNAAGTSFAGVVPI